MPKKTLEEVITEMREEAAMASREAEQSPPAVQGQMLFQGAQVKGAVAAAIADSLLYWADQLKRIRPSSEK